MAGGRVLTTCSSASQLPPFQSQPLSPCSASVRVSLVLELPVAADVMRSKRPLRKLTDRTCRQSTRATNMVVRFLLPERRRLLSQSKGRQRHLITSHRRNDRMPLQSDGHRTLFRCMERVGSLKI